MGVMFAPILAMAVITAGTLPSGLSPDAQVTAPAAECAVTWELDGGLCYPACPPGFGASGPVCLRPCPAGYVDEGLTCRNQSQTIRKESRPRGGTQLTRSAYRDLFLKFVQLYRAGAAFLAT